jgi:hypothetical protein
MSLLQSIHFDILSRALWPISAASDTKTFLARIAHPSLAFQHRNMYWPGYTASPVIDTSNINDPRLNLNWAVRLESATMEWEEVLSLATENHRVLKEFQVQPVIYYG